jgi:hypothetical protein
MARVYLGAKDWDAGSALLQQLSTSSDAQVAAAARNDLQDLPYLKKYGIPPVHKAAATPTAPATAQPGSNATNKPAPAAPPPSKPAKSTSPAASSTVAELNDELSETSEPVIDKRPIHYLKGKLISVDCSQAPAAVLIFSSGVKTLKLKAADYKSLTLIGADAFSCSWSNRQVAVNYKAVGTEGGDLVSLEVR